MNIHNVTAGPKLPDEINVIIEIPMHGAPVKYEVDKDSGMLRVDRFLGTAMFYPANYGYVPQTLSEDGDPVDVLVVTPVPLNSGVLIPCRPIGLLQMTDESGIDAKVLAVPISKLTPLYTKIHSPEDVNPHTLASISHFFEHYKDLEEGKWVKVDGWHPAPRAKEEILKSVERYQIKCA